MWLWPHLSRVLYGATLVLLVSAPLVRGIRFVHDDAVLIMPDLNETWLSAMSAGHLDQNVGPWSRIGLFHPGPMWFYWCAPFVALAEGEPSGLFLAALALVSVSSAVIVEQVRRSLGISAALIAALVVAVAYLFLDPTGLAFPWNPTIIIVPAAAGLVSVARAAAQRSVGSACLAVVLGWLLLQSHLGALPLGGAVLAAGAALGGWALYGRPRRMIAWAVLLGLCLAIPLVPIARDQISGSGNAAAAARYALTGDVSPRFPADPPSESQNLTVGEALQESGSVTTLVQGDIARWAGADLLLAREHRPRPAAPVLMLGLILMSAAASLLLRRRSAGDAARSDFLGWLGLVTVCATLLQIVVAIRARSEFRPYLIAVSAGVGIGLWLVAALLAQRVCLTRLASVTTAGRSAIKAGLTVALTVPLALFLRAPLEGFQPQLAPSESAGRQIAGAVESGHVRLTVDRIGTLLASQQLVAALERDGITVTVEGREVAHFSDRQRQPDTEAISIEVQAADEPVPEGARLIARFDPWVVVQTVPE